MRVLIMGLPGSNKYDLAKELVRLLAPRAVHFNADDVRWLFNDFYLDDGARVRQARRMRKLADVLEPGQIALCEFVCPTEETRAAFGADFTIWMHTLDESRFADVNRVFEPPTHVDVELTAHNEAADAPAIAQAILERQPAFDGWDPRAPTALLIGRWQPFHDGHLALVEEAFARAPQVWLGVRDMPPSADNPFPFEAVRERIQGALRRDYAGRFRVEQVPNVSHVLYGRNVGYDVELVERVPAHKPSGTAIRRGDTGGAAAVDALIAGGDAP